MNREDAILTICCISTGQRLIGEVIDLGHEMAIGHPFVIEEMIMEDDSGEFITTQVSLIYYAAYSKCEAVLIPKAHIICTMEPTDEMAKCYQEELTSVNEQKSEKSGKKKESGTVVSFKKKN